MAAACAAVAFSVGASAPGAGAAVTLGQLSPKSPADPDCSVSDFAQSSVTSGNSYVVPGNGTIISWGTSASAPAGQTYAMKVFRKVAEPARYMVVGHDSRPLTGGVVNSFPASIPVKPGDLLGSGGSDPNSACVYSTPSADVWLSRPNNLADGESGDFTVGSTARVNVSAVFVYSNSFNLGKVDRNKRKGTATLPVDVPNPGVLALSGAGVRSEQASAAAGSAGNAFAAAGTVNLLIKPKGKKRRALNESGRVKVKIKVTYTPTGGDPRTKSRKLKLEKR